MEQSNRCGRPRSVPGTGRSRSQRPATAAARAVVAVILAAVGFVVAGCGTIGDANPRRPTTTAAASTASPPPVTDNGALVVCGELAPLIARLNGRFNALGSDAAPANRRAVAAAFDAGAARIRQILGEAGLASSDPVHAAADRVADRTGQVARLLRSGSAVGNTGLADAQRALSAACVPQLPRNGTGKK